MRKMMQKKECSRLKKYEEKMSVIDAKDGAEKRNAEKRNAEKWNEEKKKDSCLSFF